MRVLLISTYELGHQPIHVASPAAILRDRGHQVRAVDLSLDPWDPALVDHVDRVAISVPMHTATVLAVDIARSTRARRPELPICLYGLYGAVATDQLLGPVADAMIAGEYETDLADWVDGTTLTATVSRIRRPRVVPARDLLAPLDRYARLLIDGEERVVAAVSASHGCSSRCRHCPVSAVYDGRLRIVDPAVVAADIDQVVAAGAVHLTFADPDFLNGPHHALRIVRDLHRRHPSVTFDLTTKVELILRNEHLWNELAASGCLFVTTALECVDDDILAVLDKGHTAADADRAVTLLHHHGITVRPSLLPFTPWTTLDGIAELATFVIDHDLVDGVDPVHWTIRLLVPDGSLLLDRPELVPFLDGYDPEHLGWRWHAQDPRTDELQLQLAALVEHGERVGQDPGSVFDAVASAIEAASGRRLPDRRPVSRPAPRLSEAWFCCAAPTCDQRRLTVPSPRVPSGRPV